MYHNLKSLLQAPSPSIGFSFTAASTSPFTARRVALCTVLIHASLSPHNSHITLSATSLGAIIGRAEVRPLPCGARANTPGGNPVAASAALYLG
ncbi:conserved within P. aerophilum [Pyrobaculum aerophilum str. IM2]|uniref:Conserved within P. aerophilum n=1 Tax=Pyrobaculum aerophilum (strain ATCC 51768 / DSM 7523 / JCM 9630 / CIP 104966 / NBRC 100827 / IM2) TaxID=178306 RepID=Q8ZWF9_PYRAE|nr:conserved within P. aerophilum [Pyrobaculum aerophilum str. IM2]